MPVLTPPPRKIPTTVRLDPSLRSWAKSFAESSGTDLSTLITLSLTQIKRVGYISLYENHNESFSPEKIRELTQINDHITAGILPLSQSFLDTTSLANSLRK